LVNTPALANDPKIASDLLAHFLKHGETKIRECLASHDLGGARKVVNGGHHGLAAFTSAYNIGNGIIG
jgi:hypothetical protein